MIFLLLIILEMKNLFIMSDLITNLTLRLDLSRLCHESCCQGRQVASNVIIENVDAVFCAFFIQFSLHVAYYSVCENSCIMCPVALEELSKV